MIRIAILFSLLFCMCAGGINGYAADRQKKQCGLEHKAPDDHRNLIADDDGDDGHALIKRNVHSFIPSYTPFIFQRNAGAYETADVNKASPRSMLIRICVLRL